MIQSSHDSWVGVLDLFDKQPFTKLYAVYDLGKDPLKLAIATLVHDVIFSFQEVVNILDFSI